MRPQSIADDDLIDALSRVISRHGYQGASLQLLSEASGLKRASLYHRFPGGKAEILEAAVDRAGTRFTEMLAPAFGDGSAGDRASEVATRIDRYYDGGQESCLIVALSLADGPRRAMATPCLDAWTAAFTKLASDSGLSRTESTTRASDLVAQIEGALVIASATGDVKPFARALGRVVETLTTR